MTITVSVSANNTNPIPEITSAISDLFFSMETLTRSSTEVTLEGFGSTATITGTGFTYDNDGLLTGGTFQSITYEIGTTVVTFSGLSLSAADLRVAVIAELVNGDLSALEEILLEQDWVYNTQGPDQIESLLPNELNSDGFILNLKGNDRLNLGGGDDAFFLGDGNDTGNGGTGADTLWGGNGADVLNGQAGNDRLIGNGGNDRGFGGDGNDTMIGGFGGDRLVGQAGNDRLIGNAGNDTLLGGNGRDVLLGQGGNDRVIGNGGNDTVNGGGGNDLVSGQAGADQVIGGAGNDTLFGGAGADILRGGNGADEINGGNGNDQIFGGGGPDVLIFSGGNFGMDTVTGFADGIDLLRLDIASVQTIAQDGANTVITSTAGEITLVNIQASDVSDADFIQI